MEKLRSAFTRKLGPLPAWGWGIIVAGALYFYRQHGGIGTGTGGNDQQATPTYYGPYGQDSFPIQGGAGTGPGDSGTQDVAPASGGPPVINVQAQAPDKAATPGKKKPKPRKHKPKPQHKPKQQKHDKGKTHTSHGNPNHHRPRHPAATHPGSATRPRPTGGAAVGRNVAAHSSSRQQTPAHHPAPARHPAPAHRRHH